MSAWPEKASARYELLDPTPAPVNKSRRFMGIMQALGGFVPLATRPAWELQVRERTTGRIVYSTTTRNGVSLSAWQETLSKDLASLTRNEFDREYGIDQP